MTKRKLFLACGTLVLAVSGFLATHANKKYAATLSAYFRTTTTSAFITLFKGLTLGTMHLTTVAFTNHTAFFRSKSMATGNKTLFATKGTAFKLYYK